MPEYRFLAVAARFGNTRLRSIKKATGYEVYLRLTKDLRIGNDGRHECGYSTRRGEREVVAVEPVGLTCELTYST
jgi:hypothetical protein